MEPCGPLGVEGDLSLFPGGVGSVVGVPLPPTVVRVNITGLSVVCLVHMSLHNMSSSSLSINYSVDSLLHFKDDSDRTEHSTAIFRNMQYISLCTFLPALPVWYEACKCSTDAGSTDCPHLHSVKLA